MAPSSGVLPDYDKFHAGKAMTRSPSTRCGLLRRIDAAQHLLEMALHGLVAQAGAALQGVGIPHREGATPRVENAFGAERLDDAADIAAADAEQGGELLMRQRHDRLAIGPVQRRDDPLRRALLDR